MDSHAAPVEREKYEITQDREMIIWGRDKCSINDEVCVDDYLGNNLVDDTNTEKR